MQRWLFVKITRDDARVLDRDPKPWVGDGSWKRLNRLPSDVCMSYRSGAVRLNSQFYYLTLSDGGAPRLSHTISDRPELSTQYRCNIVSGSITYRIRGIPRLWKCSLRTPCVSLNRFVGWRRGHFDFENIQRISSLEYVDGEFVLRLDHKVLSRPICGNEVV